MRRRTQQSPTGVRRNPPAFDAALVSPEFQQWFEGACAEVRNDDGSPRLFYRGRSAGSDLQARLVLDSFTTSPEIASMYTGGAGIVFPVYLNIRNPLVIDKHFVTFYELLNYLEYWDGSPKAIDPEESVKILNYLASRERKSLLPAFFQPLPRFAYEVHEYEFDDEYEYEPDLYKLISAWRASLYLDRASQETLAENLAIDTFAAVETPAFKRALAKLGYDGVIHLDPVSQKHLEKSSGKRIEDIADIKEPTNDWDWQDLHTDYVHWTYRTVSRDQVWPALLYGATREI